MQNEMKSFAVLYYSRFIRIKMELKTELIYQNMEPKTELIL